jgi:hypothetical protein
MNGITMNTRLITALVAAIVLTLAFTACDQSPKVPIEDRKVIPELKGIILGSSLRDVFAVAFGERFSPAKIFIESENSYTVLITADSLIPSIGGSSDYRISLEFLKDKEPENALLKSLTATMPADSFDGVLQGLREKYGEGRVNGKGNDKSYNWSLFGSRYRVSIFKGKSRDEELVFISMTEMSLNNESVRRNEELAAKKKASDSRDL